MKEDAKEAREKAKARAGKRYSETQGTARGVEKEDRGKPIGDTDAISISESGKATLDGKTGFCSDCCSLNALIPISLKTERFISDSDFLMLPQFSYKLTGSILITSAVSS